MTKKIYFFLILFLFLLSTDIIAAEKTSSKKTSYEYKIPSRAIIISPYISYIFSKDLYDDIIKNQSGFGGGLNISAQIYKNFGYLIDVFAANLKINKDENIINESREGIKFAGILSGGFYYAIIDWKIDLCYGAIMAGNNVMTIFIPAVEYNKKIYSRISLFSKLNYLITNDWIVDMKYKEHYTSFSVSAGVSFIF